MQLDSVSAFIVATIAQGLFVVFMLWKTNPVSTRARTLLSLIILLFLWIQLEFLLIRGKVDLGFFLIYGTRYGVWLAFGPLFWLYLKAYFRQEQNSIGKTLVHFLPFVIFTVLIPLTNLDLLTWRSVDYGMLTVFDSWNQNPITGPQYLYGSIFLIQFLHAVTYLIFSSRLLSGVENGLRQQYSNYDTTAIQWHKLFLRSSLIAIIAITAFIGYQFFTGDYRRSADYFYVVPMSTVLYLLIYHGIKFPNLIFKTVVIEPVDKYEKSSLPSSASSEYARKLQTLIEERKLYLKRELGLQDLAEEMEVSTHHLSQSINESLNRNFYELINQYRVEEAKNRIKSDSEKSLLQVAFEVGFNNKASFNNAFKKHVGMTPSRYRATA